jgi:predicted PhzF superfamily epimerase YddE/YHI9
MTVAVSFYFVDVFASQPLSGNPLSLVADADRLDEAQMRAIAREFNQSETTFLLRPSLAGATWRLRSFTPIGAEVAGAGHNALGAWLWLAAAGRLGPGHGELVLAQEIAGEVLPVQVIRAGPVTVWMSQSPSRFGGCARDRAELAAALGLTESDLVADETAQVVSTGAGHLMVPARDRSAVDRAAPHRVRVGCAQAWIHSRNGKIPIVLLTRPQPAGERVYLWCRAGTSTADFTSARGLLSAACWADDVYATRHPRYAHLVMLDVIHRRPPSAPAAPTAAEVALAALPQPRPADDGRRAGLPPQEDLPSRRLTA